MNLNEALNLLSHEPSAAVDLAEVALLVARDEYPAVDVEATLGELSALAHDLRPRLRGPLPSRVAALSRYLFHELGFRGNSENYYDPRNSYFNEVLDRRLGLPITLSLVAMSVGGRAGLNLVGVGLPGHFIAKAVGPDEAEVLFDPFHGGQVLTPSQCEAMVEQVTGARFHATPETLTAASAHSITVRLLSNLKGVYLHSNDFARAARIGQRLCQLLPNDPRQKRDLGVALLHAGQPGQSLRHLAAYLDALPEADDAQTVRQFLRKAQGDIARWN
jgi:regulator of sirC expression with transglutaminase-like and TPR domain